MSYAFEKNHDGISHSREKSDWWSAQPRNIKECQRHMNTLFTWAEEWDWALRESFAFRLHLLTPSQHSIAIKNSGNRFVAAAVCYVISETLKLPLWSWSDWNDHVLAWFPPHLTNSKDNTWLGSKTDNECSRSPMVAWSENSVETCARLGWSVSSTLRVIAKWALSLLHFLYNIQWNFINSK